MAVVLYREKKTEARTHKVFRYVKTTIKMKERKFT